MERLEQIRKKVEERVGKPVSELELLKAMDDAKIIESLARSILAGERRCFRGSCMNIDGWTVRMGSDGYYRMYKTVDGRTESLYLGKRLDFKKARRKIEKKERDLGISW